MCNGHASTCAPVAGEVLANDKVGVCEVVCGGIIVHVCMYVCIWGSALGRIGS